MNFKKFLKDNFYLMASTALGGIFGYLFHFSISRKLSVSEYGELQSLISLIAIFGVFSSALSFFIVKYSSILADHHDKTGQAEFISFVFEKFRLPIGVFSIIFIASMPIAKKILHLPDYLGLVSIGASIVLLAISSFYVNSLQGWRNFLWVGIIGAFTPLAKMISGYFFASLSPNASIVSLSVLVSAFFGWIIARQYCRKYWPESAVQKKAGSWKEKYFHGDSFRKSMLYILAFSSALAIVNNLDILIIKNLTDSHIAGYYGALSVLGKIILWINLSIIGVILPEAFSFGYFGKPVEKEIISRSYGLIFVASVPAILFYYFFSKSLIGALFGEKYLVVAPLLWLFGLMAVFLSLLMLEAKLALARHARSVSILLTLVAISLISSLVLFHNSLKEIVLSVSVSFLAGWLLLFASNLKHRLRFRARTESILYII